MLASLGYVQIPIVPVEATIALSIAFVAAEIVHARRGIVELTMRTPWVVAFVFGLLHGFGFAGALGELGLPHGHIPTALLFFNVGVELGQLFFIAVVLGMFAVSRRLHFRMPHWLELVSPYNVGGVAMFWFFNASPLYDKSGNQICRVKLVSQPAPLTVLRSEGVAKTLWRTAQTRDPRRRSLAGV